MQNDLIVLDIAITSIMSTPGIIGLSGKCPGKKLSLMVTFLIATADSPALYSITLSTRRNGKLHFQETNNPLIKITSFIEIQPNQHPKLPKKNKRLTDEAKSRESG